MKRLRSALSVWLAPLGIALGVSCALMIGGRWIEYWLAAPKGGAWFRNFIFPADPGLARDSILNQLQSLAQVFGITITVVAFVVQLAATRYTSRVVDLFLKDFRNRAIFFVYVVPLVMGLWLANVIDAEDYSRLAVGAFMVLATLATILIIPYFTFVFVFLQPNNIIARIEGSIESELTELRAGRRRVERARGEVTNSLRQLSDIALSSLGQSDLVL